MRASANVENRADTISAHPSIVSLASVWNMAGDAMQRPDAQPGYGTRQVPTQGGSILPGEKLECPDAARHRN
jgi:hypothetical protein